MFFSKHDGFHMSCDVSKHLIYFIFIKIHSPLPSSAIFRNLLNVFLSPENINTIKITFDWPLHSQLHCKHTGNS